MEPACRFFRGGGKIRGVTPRVEVDVTMLEAHALPKLAGYAFFTWSQSPGTTGNELLDRFWRSAAAVGEQNPGGVDAFLGYASKVIELRYERVMVREQSRSPDVYWGVLYVVALLAMAAVGYHGGVAGTNRRPVMVAVAIAFSAIILVIADLDRPGEGFINVSQEPMIELRHTLAAYPN